MEDSFEYTVEEAVELIQRTIDRKRKEIAALEKKQNRLKRESSIAENQELLNYLKYGVTTYLVALSELTDDASILDGVDTDAEPVECPVKYDKYLSGLSADDLENELEAEAIRDEVFEAASEEICIDIASKALDSKKMIKVLLEDVYALSVIGELIFYDEYLYDAFMALGNSEEKKKKKHKKD